MSGHGIVEITKARIPSSQPVPVRHPLRLPKSPGHGRNRACEQHQVLRASGQDGGGLHFAGAIRLGHRRPLNLGSEIEESMQVTRPA